MPAFRAAYLIHGDDHGRIAERRANLRTMAETAAGTAGVEVYENEACTPENIIGALTAMTFAMGRRFVIADGVERWKESDVDPVAAALTSADPETVTVAFFAREEGRSKAPAKLHEAVTQAGCGTSRSNLYQYASPPAMTSSRRTTTVARLLLLF